MDDTDKNTKPLSKTKVCWFRLTDDEYDAILGLALEFNMTFSNYMTRMARERIRRERAKLVKAEQESK